MKTKMLPRTFASLIALMPALALAFNSGSTGADGAFNPTVSQQITLPDSGVFNYTSVNIPAGVTISYKKNAANTPVVILATGDVNIAGNLWLGGGNSPDVGAGGNGNVGDDGLPGNGSAGGYAGGSGGQVTNKAGGDGLGPGGGMRGGNVHTSGGSTYLIGGGGGGFGSVGTDAECSNYSGVTTGKGGVGYGSSQLLPLIGGSGGGGGLGGSAFPSSGGGGGGGGILIAASGTVTVSGTLTANGGNSGATGGDGRGATGGGGAGGAIRIVATTIAGNGTISATGGASGAGNGWLGSVYSCRGGAGSVGRIRLEAETITRTAASTPTHSFGAPGLLFVAGLPSLRISSVAGVAAPPNPTGNADITLPSGTANPVTVTFATTGVPVGNTVKLTVTPSYGAPVSAISPAITGTTENGTASVTVSLPTGPSVLMAQTTYTIVAALGDALSRYAGNERVEKITLTASLGQPSTMKLITVSGKTYDAPAALLATMGAQG